MPLLTQFAESVGFTASAMFDASILEPLPEVREMCAANRCSMYGKSWSCPPACGSLAEISAILKQYSTGILLQSTGMLEDEFDADGIRETEKIHKKRFAAMTHRLRLLEPDCLPLSAGACTVCTQCTYPYRPCRFPQKMFSSMEAYGLLVSRICEKAGLPYYYGPGRITFTSCILFHKEVPQI